MATKLAVLLLVAAVNINSLVNSSKTYKVNEGIINCKWQPNTDVNDFKLYCPDLDGNVQINLKKESLLIECKESTKFNFTIFHKLNLFEVRNVNLTNCIVEENINFGSILDHFGINNTKTFSVENIKGLLQPLPFSNGFESLENLTMCHNVVRKLDERVFQALREVRVLKFYDNKITDLPRNIFANLTNLEVLLLSKNKIESLDEGLFTHQKELKYLALNDNEILDLPRNIFANLRNLEMLWLSKNKIKFLEEGLFTHLKKLKYLELEFNEISDLPRNIFVNLTNLETLLLSKNKIESLEEGLFAHQKKLKYLTLNDNEKLYLPRNIFANLTNLEKLWLSKNKIESLDEELFTHQKELKYLSLNDNEILYLPRNIFANLTNLEMLSLSKNKIKFLEEGLFTYQNELRTLRLNGNEISYISRNIFANLTNLTDLEVSEHEATIPVDLMLKVNRIEVFNRDKSYLTKLPFNYNITNMFLHRLKIANGFALPSNFEIVKIIDCKFEFASGKNESHNTTHLPSGKRVHSLPFNIFANQTKLIYLSLEKNGLTEVNDGLFNGLNKLERLDLSYNNLTSISGLIFRELHNLNTIYLSANHIKSIDSDAFVHTTKLKRLDLRLNQLRYFDAKKFMYLKKLLFLHLSYNYLSTLPSGWKDIKSLRLLDLGFNNISSYKYGDVHNSKNKIYYKAYHQLSVEELRNMKIVEDDYLSIFLNNITLKCDCSMLRFLLVQKEGVINGFVNHLSEICQEQRARCNETIATYSYDCPITEYVECKCTPNFENHIEMRCERPSIWNSSMNFLPIDPRISLELYINKSIFTELPNLQNNERVVIIQASYNNINNIKLENIPPNLRFLDVSYNKIKAISTDVIDALHNNKKLEAFLIENNKWQCDCSTNSEKFIEFFTEIISMTDFQETKARLPSDVVIELSSKALKDYCAMETQNNILYILALLSAIIGILGIFIVILLYKYKKALKIWLYAHNICLCCIGEDEFDKDKEFDAFISYSYHDEDLAVSILNELETGNPKYNICIHERDFVPGRLIQLSIVESMDNSCRTIIVLSKHFLRSVWGLREFRRAYESGLAERRMRLIIVINGDIGDTDQLEPTIKCYLKTHTYIKWGDPWFWRKMRYALPHRNRNDDGGNTATNNIEMRQMS